MGIRRVFQYAQVQARVRARIGGMPEPAQWRRVADARDLDTLIARMRENGLAYWISGLPRNPDTEAIERHMLLRLRVFFRDLGRLLPGRRWRAARRWLRIGGNLLFVGQILRDDNPPLPEDIDPLLRDTAALSRGDRRAELLQSVYGPYLGRSANWHAWWQQLRQVCPPFDRAERRYLDRVISPIGSHLRRIALAPALTDGDPDLQWQWRNELAGHMRQTLGGDPYHLGLVVAYGALEAIHFERCRALLISQSRGWRAPRVLQGVL